MRMPQYLDLLNAGRMQRKGSLHTNTMGGNPAHCERRFGASSLTNAHDRATDQLDPLAVALHDTKVHLHIVADLKLGQIGLFPVACPGNTKVRCS